MKRTRLLVLALVLSGLSACKKDPKDTGLNPPAGPPQNDSVEFLKINEIQVVGSHNSYRQRTTPAVYDFVVSLFDAGWLSANLDPKGWDYSHVPLPEQMGAYGMRGVELDIYEDAQGGRFYNRGALVLVSQDPASGIQELNEPGFKILHIPDFDYNTNYFTFKKALTAIKQWSESNPRHVPVFVNIESKTETVGDQIGLSFLLTSIPYSASSAEAVEAEIRSVFGPDLQGVFTPDNLRGTFGTLREAVLANNWPTLAEARGKIIFAMEGSLVPFYKQGHPSLQGRAMFTYADPQDDEAAFILINDPVNSFAQIQQVTGQGFMVRTRADAETVQARTGDYAMMNSAFASGAQIISTDYYRADERYKTRPDQWTDYHVAFPGGKTFRINPVTAPGKLGLGFIGE